MKSLAFLLFLASSFALADCRPIYKNRIDLLKKKLLREEKLLKNNAFFKKKNLKYTSKAQRAELLKKRQRYKRAKKTSHFYKNKIKRLKNSLDFLQELSSKGQGRRIEYFAKARGARYKDMFEFIKYLNNKKFFCSSESKNLLGLSEILKRIDTHALLNRKIMRRKKTRR